MRKTQSSDGIVSFVEAFTTEGALSKLRNKLPQVEKRSVSEIDANKMLDSAIQSALGDWRGKAKDMNSLLKTPDNIQFTWEELDLAGWIQEYATQASLSFKLAMEQIFDYMKRYPKSLERYTGGDANFAESCDSSVSFAAPRGWTAAPQQMEVFRRARVYQAGNPGCEFSKAVALMAQPSSENQSRIEFLKADNERMRAALARRTQA